MRKTLTILTCLLLALPCLALEQRTYVSDVNMDEVEGDWDSFSYKVIGMDDASFKMGFRNDTYPYGVTNSGDSMGVRVSRGNVIYIDIADDSITKLSSNITFSVARTNIPPDGTYKMEVWSWEGAATNTSRTIAQGMFTVNQSLYANTNAFPFPSTTITNLTDYLTKAEAVTIYETIVVVDGVQETQEQHTVTLAWLGTSLGSVSGAVDAADVSVLALSNTVDALDVSVLALSNTTGWLGSSLGSVSNAVDVQDVSILALSNTVGVLDVSVLALSNTTGWLETSLGSVSGAVDVTEARLDGIDTNWPAGDIIASNAFVAADAVVSLAYQAADMILSNAFELADTALSNSLVVLYGLADTALSNSIVTLINAAGGTNGLQQVATAGNFFGGYLRVFGITNAAGYAGLDINQGAGDKAYLWGDSDVVITSSTGRVTIYKLTVNDGDLGGGTNINAGNIAAGTVASAFDGSGITNLAAGVTGVVEVSSSGNFMQTVAGAVTGTLVLEYNVTNSAAGGGSGFPLTADADYAGFGQTSVLYTAYVTNAAPLGTAAGTSREYLYQDPATSEWRKYLIFNAAGTTTTNFWRMD